VKPLLQVMEDEEWPIVKNWLPPTRARRLRNSQYILLVTLRITSVDVRGCTGCGAGRRI